jgi:hypothetical protein
LSFWFLQRNSERSNNLHLIHDQCERTERDVDLSPSDTINNLVILASTSRSQTKHRSSTSLPTTNQDYLAGALPDLPVEWKSLPDDYGQIILDGDRPVLIYLDPQANDTVDELNYTLRHESCHALPGIRGQRSRAGVSGVHGQISELDPAYAIQNRPQPWRR